MPLTPPVQTPNGVILGSTTNPAPAPTWGTATTSGNLLLCILAYQAASSSVSAPSGWSKILFVSNGSASTIELWSRFQSSSRSGSETFTISSGSTPSSSAILLEYAVNSTSMDQSNTNTGTGTALDSGSITITGPVSKNSLIVAGLFTPNNALGGAATSPGGGFTIELQETLSVFKANLAALDNSGVPTTYDATATSPASTSWSGLIASFFGSTPVIDENDQGATFTLGQAW